MSDETYLVEIIRDTLDDYQNRVANEEAGASEFQDNQVSPLDNQVTNLTTFRVLPAGTLVEPPTFVVLDALPSGKVALWSGVVLLGGKNVAVSLYR